MTQYIAYCRRSTDTEQQAKWSLDTQYEDIQNFVSANGGEILGRYDEVRSGTDTARPILWAAIDECEKTGAVLIVSKLSRLSRDIGQVDELYRSNLRFVVVEFGIECSYEQILMFGMVNALMVQNLRKSVKRGIAKSRAAGTQWRCITPEEAQLGAKATSAKYQTKRDELCPMIDAMRSKGMTYEAISGMLNAAGVKTARGKRWSKHTVIHLHKRWSKDNEQS